MIRLNTEPKLCIYIQVPRFCATYEFDVNNTVTYCDDEESPSISLDNFNSHPTLRPRIQYNTADTVSETS